MAINRTISITFKGANSGPFYELYYSIDLGCSTFVYQENVYLPFIGSEVTVSVPDNTQCIKLVSLGTCDNSETEVNPAVNQGDFYLLDFNCLDFTVY